MKIIQKNPWIVLVIILAAMCIAGEMDYQDRIMGYDAMEVK